MHLEDATKGKYRNIKKRLTWKVDKQSKYVNIYHCCTQKTASQCFRRIFSDECFYRHTGLLSVPYKRIGLNQANLKRGIPNRCIGVHLYINYSTFANMKKPQSYKAFFILRDPRDIVISWYYSAKYSHRLISVIPELRGNLERLSFDDGVKYIIDKIADYGTFSAQRSWVSDGVNISNTRVFRYEDFATDNAAFFKDLFNFLDVAIPTAEFENLLKKNSFESLSQGRSQGHENISSHYRKGISGDWKQHFNDTTMSHFEDVTGDLLELLGYQS